MSFKKRGAFVLVCLALVLTAVAEAGSISGQAQGQPERSKPPEVERITVDELKGKLAKGEPITIIDIRASAQYVDSSQRIKGALHVKSRRLKSRLQYAPLKDLPRDREIVTYCA